MAQQYKIIFNGSIIPGFAPDEVKNKTASLFGLTPQKMAELFNGKEYTLRKGLTHDDAAQFVTRLKKIGLLTTFTEENAVSPTLNQPRQPRASPLPPLVPEQKTHSQSKLLMILMLILLALMGAAAYFLFLKTPPPAPAPEQNLSQAAQANKPSTTKMVVPTCDHENVAQIISKILIEGLPKVVTNEASPIELLLKSTNYNQELFFDATRNKRLCGLHAHYEIKSPLIEQETSDADAEPNAPFIDYEVIYEVSLIEPDQINVRTFKHTAVSTNVKQAPTAEE